MPSSEAEWLKVTEEFNLKWNFVHCIGALDGKHVAIKAPPNTGSLYYNYKNFFSLVLMALVDANYKFIYVDIGNYGRISDGGTFNNSSLGQALANDSLSIPRPDKVNGFEVEVPYVVVADDAFSLKPYIMKPYAQRGLTHHQRIYNCRLSRARKVIENAFDILSQRFRVFNHPIPLHPEKEKIVTMAACCLHNFLLRDTSSTASYTREIDRADYSDTVFATANGSMAPFPGREETIPQMKRQN